jgi:3-hydroxybutyryl-CoA dehydratase
MTRTPNRASEKHPMPSLTHYFEDFEVGQTFQSYSRTITEADLSLFCALVGYHTPMFIDEHYAKTTRFGGRVVPGSLTASFSTASIEAFFRESIVAHLSNREARFLAPVRPGDTITTHVEVIGKKDSDKPHGMVSFRDTVKNQDGVVVYTVEKTTLIAKKKTAGA